MTIGPITTEPLTNKSTERVDNKSTERVDNKSTEPCGDMPRRGILKRLSVKQSYGLELPPADSTSRAGAATGQPEPGCKTGGQNAQIRRR